MDNYKINKNIDRESRFMGLTLDEFIPFLAILVMSFALKSLLSGVSIAIVFVLLIKRLKKGRRGSFLLNVIYWYTPKFIIKRGLFVTPASEDRFFLR